MTSEFDMLSGELLHRQHAGQRWVDRRRGAGLESGRQADLQAEWDELNRTPHLELALLPVASEKRR